jgi:hypothetical protein
MSPSGLDLERDKKVDKLLQVSTKELSRLEVMPGLAEIVITKQVNQAPGNESKTYKAAPNHPWRKCNAILFSEG